jgi:NAD(P)-dependent dehydrogenase (short-subunit alcohol dehydrogenase family)
MWSDLMGLQGKVALVTGSTRGIGLATARLLAEAGAKVVISSRKPEACEAVQAQFAADGHEVLAVPCHVGEDADRVRLVETVMAAWGRLDVLVVNAAVNPVFAPLQAIEPGVWAKVVETNLTSPWRLAQLALPHIADQGGGAMVMISSIASLVATPMGGPYAVSKAAENHLARQLAAEWGPRNVRVNVVAPGTTRTDMIRALAADEARLQRLVDRTVLGRIGEPRDVAAAIVFLLSEAARQITGQVLVVDGGETLTTAGRT